MNGRARDMAALALLSALVRLPSLGGQSLDRDEAVTVGRVIQPDFFETLRAIGGETTPPLIYVLTWFPVKLFGAGEVSGRVVAAIAGVLIAPVAYEIGRTLASRRIGVVLGLLAALNPYLFWYSQEGRPYTLLVLFSALSFLFFARVLDGGGRRDLLLWAGASVLAFSSHWFAGSLVAVEAAVLIWRTERTRDLWIAMGATGAAALVVAPLFLYQAAHGGGDWIGDSALSERARQTGEKFMTGELGHLADWALPVTAALVALAFALVALRGERRERRAAGLGMLAAAAAVLLPALPALVGRDYLIAKNVLAGLIPLALAVATGLGARRAGALGPAAAVALVGASGWLVALGTFDAEFRRPPWGEAVQLAGAPAGPRAVVAPYNSDASMEFYLDGARQLRDGSVTVSEIVVIGMLEDSPRPAGFRLVDRRTAQDLRVHRFRSSDPRRVTYRELVTMDLGGGCSPDRDRYGCEQGVVLLDG